MEQLFSLLFGHRFFFFREGELTFLTPLSLTQILLIVLAVAVVAVFLYRRQLTSGRNPGWAWVTLRFGFFLLLFAILLRPALTLSTLIPKENLLVLLVDNSASMALTEKDTSRGHAVTALLQPESKLVQELDEDFHLRWLSFDSRARTLEDINQLDWQGKQTNIAIGLETALAYTRNLPLGGILLFTDGSDNSFNNNGEILAELKARKIPVHTVGVGPESLERDVEIAQISTARNLLPDTVAVARVTLRQQGYGGSRGRLEVREGNSLVEAKEVYFPQDSELATAEVLLQPKSGGIKEYEFRVLPLTGEPIEQNNSRRTLIEVRDLTPRILYVEGHPRWEYKFLRQAVADDQHLRLETLLRTAINKFYRQGIEEETTLAAGFPSSRDELFEYRGLIFGNLESAFFTYAQMEIVRDFVGKRGGGFLMLGGSAAFADGGYRNTPVEEVLPVWLPEKAEDATRLASTFYHQSGAQVELTPYGSQHPALQLGTRDTAQNNQQIWAELPMLTDWNQVRTLKSGATVLAQISGERDQDRLPLFVSHRYGRGLGLALLTGSSWHWQMLQDHGNQSHETFWRQLLRWLISSAKDRVSVETEREIYSQNEPVRIRTEVNDESFNRVNDARVEAEVTTPSGQTNLLPMQWNVREDGVYEAEWNPREDGLYRVTVTALGAGRDKSQSYGRARTYFLTSTGQREYFDAVQKKDYLKTLAEETGGRYYSISDASRLPEEILYTESQSSIVEVFELWNMPINFILLVGLLFGEWILRKRQGAI